MILNLDSISGIVVSALKRGGQSYWEKPPSVCAVQPAMHNFQQGPKTKERDSILVFQAFFTFTFPLTAGGCWGTTDDFATSFLHFSLFSTALWDWQNPGLSIPWCCLPTCLSVCLVFFPLSLCLARWFWSDLMNGRHDHTTAVCSSLRWSGDLRVVQLPAGSWYGLPCC